MLVWSSSHEACDQHHNTIIITSIADKNYITISLLDGSDIFLPFKVGSFCARHKLLCCVRLLLIHSITIMRSGNRMVF